MLCTTSAYSQITSTDSKNKNPSTNSQSKQKPVEQIFNSNSALNKVSNLVSYRLSKKKTNDQNWSDWEYENVKIELDENNKTLKISNKSNIRIKYEGFTVAYDNEDGGSFYPSKAIDQYNRPVKLLIYIGKNQSYIILGFADTLYKYELIK
ncbi:MAG: hypothetical protein A2465_00905 [Bacteroidetes bacterium RIFOXYC2_FULL_39_11]|nr:MAG: hypothetical protein A2465_00905 [Bacteroidetes bacterium RIFOXYC2_FULL_39_11]